MLARKPMMAGEKLVSLSDNLVLNGSFSEGPGGFDNWESVNNHWLIHTSICDPEIFPNTAAEMDQDKGGVGWQVGEEDWLRQVVETNGTHNRIIFGLAESHHMISGTAEIILYGSLNGTDWTEVWTRPTVEEGSRGAGKSCTQVPRYSYVIPTSISYKFYKIEIHGKYQVVGDGWLVSEVSLQTGLAISTPTPGDVFTTQANGNNDATTVTVEVTVTDDDNRILLAWVGLQDPDELASFASVTLDPGGENEASFTKVDSSTDDTGTTRIHTECWLLVAPTSGTFNVQAVTDSGCHNLLITVEQYNGVNQADPIGTVDKRSRPSGTTSNTPYIYMQPEANGSYISAGVTYKNLVTFTPGIEDTQRASFQSDGLSARDTSMWVGNTPAEQGNLFEIFCKASSANNWAAIGVEIKKS